MKTKPTILLILMIALMIIAQSCTDRKAVTEPDEIVVVDTVYLSPWFEDGTQVDVFVGRSEYSIDTLSYRLKIIGISDNKLILRLLPFGTVPDDLNLLYERFEKNGTN